VRSRVGFFGGSFDPIHLGHLNIAIELAERHKLDEVLVCPTSQSPFKKEKPPIASKEHRRAMVTAAISPLPNFTLLDFELQKSMPCYTIDTIRQLIAIDEQHKKNKSYFLLLGEDAIEHFHAWREVEELVKLATPLIGSRQNKGLLKDNLKYFDSARQSQIEAQRSERRSPSPIGKGEEEERFVAVAASQNALDYPLAVPKSFPQKGLSPALLSAIEKGLTQIPLMEISSTEIRNRLEKGLYCGHLLPAKVWDYIQQHELYEKKS